VGDWKEFTSGRSLAAWIGLVPRQHSTGGKERLGRISKQGNRHLRWLLVAALSISYNIAVAMFGFAPFTATWLIGATGSNLAPSYVSSPGRHATPRRLSRRQVV
jgi:hypothetical protein